MTRSPVRKDNPLTNPFDNPDGRFLVLRNDEGQYSLWPVFADVPLGWHVTHGPAGRQSCVDHVEANWTDMRPKSLIEAMSEDGANGASVS